jgi:hypothetical protein|nr:MAG TPA: hypothetical protein [Caudoviricetes sp.]
MERLTEWENGSVTYNEKREIECGEYCDSCSQGAGNCETIKNMIKKLADYEDLEEQGLLVRLPCKVGDTVYVPTRNFISELRIVMISVDMHDTYFRWMLNSGIYPNLDGFSGNKLGKAVFLTHEEAEKKLEELKNEI